MPTAPLWWNWYTRGGVDCRVRYDIDARRSEIEKWIEEYLPKSEMCRRLRCKPITLDLRLSKWGIAYGGNRGLKGQKEAPNRLTALEYIATPNPSTHKARLKLIEDGVFEARCSRCGIEEWMGHPVPLELDHADGNRFNWALNNLRVLCANCHAQSKTNSGNNVGRYAEVA